MKKILVIASVLLLANCGGEINHTVKTQTQTNAVLIAGVGDSVLKVERQRNLENIFGKADIFGRKTTEGYTEVVFAGVETNGEVVFYRKDTNILTNETTTSKSRNPFSTTSGYANHSFSGNAYGSNVSGTGTSTYNSTTLSQTSDYHVVIPAEAMAIRMPKGEKMLPVLGHKIEIIDASPIRLNYRVTH